MALRLIFLSVSNIRGLTPNIGGLINDIHILTWYSRSGLKPFSLDLKVSL